MEIKVKKERLELIRYQIELENQIELERLEFKKLEVIYNESSLTEKEGKTQKDNLDVKQLLRLIRVYRVNKVLSKDRYL